MCQEDKIYCSEFEHRLKEYGIMTNKSCTTSRVYIKKMTLHPTKKDAKQVRQAQEKQLKKLMNENESSSSGWGNKFLSYVGYNDNAYNDNAYNDNAYSGNAYNGHVYSRYGYSVSGIIGLRNLGNQCYMSSAIQLIAQTPPLFRLFRNTKNTSNQPLVAEFMNLSKASSSSSSSYTPKKIKTRFRSCIINIINQIR